MDELKKGIYKHFKASNKDALETNQGMYSVNITDALGSEDLKEQVVYQALYDTRSAPKGKYWVRPKEMFMEIIEREGKKIRRFEYLAPTLEEAKEVLKKGL